MILTELTNRILDNTKEDIEKVLVGEENLYSLKSTLRDLDYALRSAQNLMTPYQSDLMNYILDSHIEGLNSVISILSTVLDEASDLRTTQVSEEQENSLYSALVSLQSLSGGFIISGYREAINFLTGLKSNVTLDQLTDQLRPLSKIRKSYEQEDYLPELSSENAKAIFGEIEQLLEETSNTLESSSDTSLLDSQPISQVGSSFISDLTFAADSNLTADFFRYELLPYLEAVQEIQDIIDDINGEDHHPIEIIRIAKGSVNVGLIGGEEVIKIIREEITPWRREHAKQMAELERRSKKLAIEMERAEIHATNARKAKDVGETEKLEAEAALIRAQVRHQEIENDKLELLLQKDKLELAIQILERIAPDLTDEQRLEYFSRMFGPLDQLLSSKLELSDG